MPMAKSVDVGPKADYAADGMHDKFIAADHIVVTRENGKIFASSSKCTHQARTCRFRVILFCPKHKSMFTPEGVRTAGPAKTSLPRYAISVNSDGHIVVDLAPIPRSQLERPGEFCHRLTKLRRPNSTCHYRSAPSMTMPGQKMPYALCGDRP